MRLLHTSDWHIGIKLGIYDYLPSQKVFANWLLTTVKTEAIDVVLIARDIFDRAIPPSEAVDATSSRLTHKMVAGVLARAASICT